MIYGSVCSGIEAASVAWHPLGWRASFLSEIEPFPRAVLTHHYPDVPLHGDFTTIQASDYEPIDLLVGGTPCQSFSVAGLRGGMADARGNLALEYLRLAERCRPKWLVWENVPGVLSSNDGRDFASFLGGLGILGYGWAYRVLDAQYFGLAQRRKRVFVVGHSGSWRSAAAVLFEPASLLGHPAPRREARERVAAATAPSLTASGRGVSRTGESRGQDPVVAMCLNAHPIRSDGESELRAEGFDASEDGTGRGVPLVPMSFQVGNIARGAGAGPSSDVFPTLKSDHGRGLSDQAPCVAFGWQNSASQGDSCSAHHAPTLDKSKVPAVAYGLDTELNGSVEYIEPLQARNGTNGHRHSASIGSAVRRLTPRECERLQGFPSIKKRAIILVCCSDRQKTSALAEIRNLKLRPFVSGADASALTQNANLADEDLPTHLLGQDWPVALNVQIDLERSAVQISSQGRLLWSASIAEPENSSPLLMRIDAFVQLSALMHTHLVPTTHHGEAGSHESINGSTHLWTGSAYAPVCGQEIVEFVKSADKFTDALTQCMKSTTSGVGQSFQNSEQTLKIWSYCVASAINGCIPEQMRNASSYAISIETTGGYTLVPFRKKPAADGPRYRALGNSMATNVMAWIGRRIAIQDAA